MAVSHNTSNLWLVATIDLNMLIGAAGLVIAVVGFPAIYKRLENIPQFLEDRKLPQNSVPVLEVSWEEPWLSVRVRNPLDSELHRVTTVATTKESEAQLRPETIDLEPGQSGVFHFDESTPDLESILFMWDAPGFGSSPSAFQRRFGKTRMRLDSVPAYQLSDDPVLSLMARKLVSKNSELVWDEEESKRLYGLAYESLSEN